MTYRVAADCALVYLSFVGGWERWERYVLWVDKACVSVPLTMDTVDPSFLHTRGPLGGPPPAGAVGLLNSIPVALL